MSLLSCDFHGKVTISAFRCKRSTMCQPLLLHYPNTILRCSPIFSRCPDRLGSLKFHIRYNRATNNENILQIPTFTIFELTLLLIPKLSLSK